MFRIFLASDLPSLHLNSISFYNNKLILKYYSHVIYTLYNIITEKISNIKHKTIDYFVYIRHATLSQPQSGLYVRMLVRVCAFRLNFHHNFVSSPLISPLLGHHTHKVCSNSFIYRQTTRNARTNHLASTVCHLCDASHSPHPQTAHPFHPRRSASRWYHLHYLCRNDEDKSKKWNNKRIAGRRVVSCISARPPRNIILCCSSSVRPKHYDGPPSRERQTHTSALKVATARNGAMTKKLPKQRRSKREKKCTHHNPRNLSQSSEIHLKQIYSNRWWWTACVYRIHLAGWFVGICVLYKPSIDAQHPQRIFRGSQSYNACKAVATPMSSTANVREWTFVFCDFTSLCLCVYILCTAPHFDVATHFESEIRPVEMVIFESQSFFLGCRFRFFRQKQMIMRLNRLRFLCLRMI